MIIFSVRDTIYAVDVLHDDVGTPVSIGQQDDAYRPRRLKMARMASAARHTWADAYMKMLYFTSIARARRLESTGYADDAAFAKPAAPWLYGRREAAPHRPSTRSTPTGYSAAAAGHFG